MGNTRSRESSRRSKSVVTRPPTANGSGTAANGLTRARSVPDVTQRDGTGISLVTSAEQETRQAAMPRSVSAANFTPAAQQQQQQLASQQTAARSTIDTKLETNDIVLNKPPVGLQQPSPEPAAAAAVSACAPPATVETRPGEPQASLAPAAAAAVPVLPQQFEHNSSTCELLWRLVDQVLLVWPTLNPLRSANLSLISPTLLHTLTDILSKLTEQYTQLRALQVESRDSKSRVKQLHNSMSTAQQQLELKRREIDQLTESLETLQTELQQRRTTILPPLTTLPLPDVDYEPRHGPLNTKHGSTDFSSPDNGGLEASSSRSLHGYSTGSDAVDIARQLQQLQRENSQLRKQLMLSEVESTVSRRVRLCAQLVDEYDQLEDEAVNKLFTVVLNNSTHRHADIRSRQFLCDVMQISYVVALATRVRFDDVILDLLSDPTMLSCGVTPAEMTSLLLSDTLSVSPSGSLSRMVALPSSSCLKRQSVSTSNDVIKDECRWLMEQLNTFIDSRGDVIDLSLVVESVMDMLVRSYPDCCHSTLVGKMATTQTINRFIGQCCQVAWKLVNTRPQFYLATSSDGSRGRFNAQLHRTLTDEPLSRSAVIDHYTWPVLFDKRNGRVLHRGRVAVKHDKYM